MNVSQTLNDMKKLFGSEGENWTRGALARNEHGIGVPISSDAACCWCLLGALDKVSGLATRASVATLVTLKDATGEDAIWPLSRFNDNHEWPEVSALLDKAMAAAEERGV